MILAALVMATVSPTPTPSTATSSGSDPWSGFAGNLVAAVIGAAVSIGVAVYVLRRTLANDAKARKDQREVEARDAEVARQAERAALQEQIEANRRLSEQAAERDRNSARERASLDAAEALTSMCNDTLTLLIAAFKASSERDRGMAREEAHRAFIAATVTKRPALAVPELRSRIEQGLAWVDEYVNWSQDRDEHLDATFVMPEEIISVTPDYPSDPVHRAALQAISDRLAEVSSCLSAYRLDEPLPSPGTLNLPPADAD